MRTPTSLLKFIGKAALNQIGAGVAGELVFELVPDMARDVWDWWSREKAEPERRAEMETLASEGADTVRAEAEALAKELAADRPPEIRQALADYLVQVPAMIRQSMRRPGDPAGRTVPPALSPRRAEDIQSLIPPRMPRFRPGDRPLRDSDWELDRLLGVGGFGEVWLARNPNLPSSAPVALKFCLDTAAARSLRNEAALLDRVMRQGIHPGIVQLRGTYLRAETPCLEYEYVEGGDLAGLIQDWHAKGERPGPAQAARVAFRLAEIVAFAHRLDPPIVHRDLKPSNVLTFRRADGSVGFKIADFGIGAVAAAANGNGSDAPAMATGIRGAYSPLYASPQQVRGDGADPRDDVYALGVIWHQLLTGNLDDGAPTGMEWSGELAARGMSRAMVLLLASCIEHKAAKRLANAAELADRLAQALDGAPAVHDPPKKRKDAPPAPAPKPAPLSLAPGDALSAGGKSYAVGKLLGRSARFALHECPLPGGRPGILKIAASPAENPCIDREAFILRLMADAAVEIEEKNGESSPLNYAHFFPELIDSFLATDQGGRRVNILGFPEAIESFAQLLPLAAVIQGGRLRIDPKTAAWILGKTLKILGFAHSLGISNGQIDGGNILIERDHHGVILFDWTLAALHDDSAVPHEIARGEISRVAAAATEAMGGDPETGGLPPSGQLPDGRFEAFVRKLAARPPSGAAAMHREFYELLGALWPREFHPFTTHAKEQTP